MENSLYIGLSKQMVLRNHMDLISNNIANMNTTGYRSQHLLFEEAISDPRGSDDALSYVLDKGQYHDTTPGSMEYTGNQLDIAVEGKGYFGVRGPGGNVMYSRSGDMQMDATGTLTNSNGRPIATIGGGNIIIPQGSTEIKIDENGMVSNQNGQLGQIMLVEFENEQELKPVGYNLYSSENEGTPAQESRIKQGMLERSNVSPVAEMTNMIDTLRTYQSLQNAMRTENDRLRSAIQTLTGQ